MQFVAYVVRSNESGRVVYCGITTRSLHSRWLGHRKSRFALGCAIRKYGESAFSIEAIGESRSFDDLKEFEKLLIEQHGTYAPGGYNLTRGGDGVLGMRFSPETLARMSRARKGRLWTDDEKAALRAARAGKPHPFLGRHHSEETIARIKANLPERYGTANAFYGKKHSPETLAKMTGGNNHMYGKRLTPEHLEKISGANHFRYGKKHRPETLAKMSAAQRGENNPNFGKPWTPERRAKQQAAHAARRARKGG
jgi:group I intron endonuclease